MADLTDAQHLAVAFEAGRESLRDRAADPAVVARVAAGLGPLVDRGAAERQARDVIATVLDALEVAP